MTVADAKEPEVLDASQVLLANVGILVRFVHARKETLPLFYPICRDSIHL